MKSKARKCFWGIAVGYVIILCVLIYWHLFANLEQHPANPRYYLMFQKERGPILDRNGQFLAYSVANGENYRRVYATPSLSHVVGYFHQRYGVTGLERRYHEELLQGREVWTTLDLDIQLAVEKAMGDKIGSALVINPTTGAILALVSSPYVDPNLLDELWSDYLADQRSPFLNRALQGLYPPGSIVKPFVYGGALVQSLVEPDTIREDRGMLVIDDRVLHNYGSRALGKISVNQALAHSSNVVFASLAIELGENLLTCLKSFGLGSPLALELNNQSGFVPSQANSSYDLAQLGIGQGKLLVTPLQMGVAVAALANRGQLMKPYLIQELRGGLQLRRITRPLALAQVLPERVSLLVKDAMVLAVLEGTAREGVGSLANLAGKTGTAQVAGGQDHAWFVGFAPSTIPEVAVVVLIEHGGFGGVAATPVGAQIISAALDVVNSKKGKR